ncbi:MAG: hypothetical protein ACHQPI_11480 [Thermoanaerobaculia bacterium]
MTKTMRNAVQLGSTALGMLLVAHTAAAQFNQQGPKLVGTASGNAFQGWSVALSADGNTAIIGGVNDNGGNGAAWVWTRSGGVWSPQGTKLVGGGNVGAASQGSSVALSADGNTAIVGGDQDNGGAGAAWVWTRSLGVWSPQGSKLVASDASASAFQGGSVALSADGNTAMIGGVGDNAAWVWTRSLGVWSQQGNKLVGAGNVGLAYQGQSVALSGDGNTAIVGGYLDNSSAGAAWVWTRSLGVWSPQGSKLVGAGATGGAGQGWSVALSGDGNTAIVGGYADNSNAGAVWVWTRSLGVWSPQGSKLVGAGATGGAGQGWSVALSADGNTAFVGGANDNGGIGASWVWTRSGISWSPLGSKLVGSVYVGASKQGKSVALSGDGSTAIVGGWSDNTNVGAAWVFVVPASATQLAFVQPPIATVAGQPITPAVTVQLEDSGGSPVAQGGVTITMSLSSGTGTLGGTLSQVTDGSGLATFNDLSINLAGPKQLTADPVSLTPAVSSTFTIAAAAAVNIVATGGTPQSAPISTQFGQPLQVLVTDTFGNPVVGALVTYGAPGSGASAGLGNGGSATTDASGHASVTATANGTVGGPYLVSAATGTLEPVTFSLTNLPAAAAAQIPALDGVGLSLLAALLAVVAVKAVSRK